MIKKFNYGNPFNTESVVISIAASAGAPSIGNLYTDDNMRFEYTMSDSDAIYGLGEANRGINKRGYIYESYCSDDPHHHEDTLSLYAAHNFIVISGDACTGLFFDYPGKITFDIGYTKRSLLSVYCQTTDISIYEISGSSVYDIVKQFRKLIGRSYIPPKFAFGFGQSRWGYKSENDFDEVIDNYRANQIPIDLIYMDIDYMDNYKDFTVNPDEFPDMANFVNRMRSKGVRPVPILDAGIKIEDGYFMYEEGMKNDFFCKKEDGTPFTAAVWPGYTHFPDFLNPAVRKWFGLKYKLLTDMGIEAFWNDMNEPAIFYSPEGVEYVKNKLNSFLDDEVSVQKFWSAGSLFDQVKNWSEDYERFYHNVDGEPVCHETIHNLYGYNMTRAAGEALAEISPDKRMLLFSRSSYIGMHRYGGVWTGDNKSWWSHLLLNIKMMPSLNMCGFLYVGADLGGFGCNTTSDLLLRWLAFGVFTPLMRNHSAEGTRVQECYRFGEADKFRSILNTRYRLIPYIYSEYMKAALNDELYFKALAFEYPDDPIACETEDELLIGNEILIAPVHEQNVSGRVIYLPEAMMPVRFRDNLITVEKELNKGHHYINVALDEVVLFIRKGKCIPVADTARCVDELDLSTLKLYGYNASTYIMYDDDGYTRSVNYDENIRIMKN